MIHRMREVKPTRKGDLGFSTPTMIAQSRSRVLTQLRKRLAKD